MSLVTEKCEVNMRKDNIIPACKFSMMYITRCWGYYPMMEDMDVSPKGRVFTTFP